MEREILEEIFHHVALGLGSEKPEHWEAALQDILAILNREGVTE